MNDGAFEAVHFMAVIADEAAIEIEIGGGEGDEVAAAEAGEAGDVPGEAGLFRGEGFGDGEHFLRGEEEIVAQFGEAWLLKAYEGVGGDDIFIEGFAENGLKLLQTPIGAVVICFEQMAFVEVEVFTGEVGERCLCADEVDEAFELVPAPANGDGGELLMNGNFVIPIEKREQRLRRWSRQWFNEIKAETLFEQVGFGF